MTYSEHVALWLDKAVGEKYQETADLGSQCVAICKAFTRNLGLTPWSTGCGLAHCIFNKYDTNEALKAEFTRIPFGTEKLSKSSDFKPGDMVVWNTSLAAGAGHVAIVAHASDDGKITVLQQDGTRDLDRRGVPQGVAHYTTWPVDNRILGVLRLFQPTRLGFADEPLPQKPEPTKIPVRIREPLELPDDPLPQEPGFSKTLEFLQGNEVQSAVAQTGKAIASGVNETFDESQSKNKDEGERVARKLGWSTAINGGAHAFALDLEKTYPILEQYDWMFGLVIAGGIFALYFGLGWVSFKNYSNIKAALESGNKPGLPSLLVQRFIFGCKERAQDKARESGDWRFYDAVYKFKFD